MNRVRWALVALGFSIALAACTERVPTGPANTANTKVTPTSPAIDQAGAKAVPASLTIPADTPLTAEAVSKARELIFRAEMDAYEKMPAYDKWKATQIRGILQKERIAALSVGLPAWVKDQLIAFEGTETSDYGVAYSRSVAWGTGTYKGRSFYWFGHTNSDAWLQMNVSIPFDKKDIDQIYGIKPGDLEGAPTKEDRMLDVHLAKPEENYTAGTATHIGLNGPVDWMNSFCTKLDSTLCDTAGALEKHLLPAANTALPGLKFTLKGRFPR